MKLLKVFKRPLSDRTVLWLCLLFIIFWSAPLWFTPGKTGLGDWDTSMHRYEAARRTVMEFKQWPGNNPWSIGGEPLLGNPCIGFMQILLVLFLGTYWGIRVAVLLYLIVGFVGAWKLSGIWWKERFIRLIFVFYTIANPALFFHLQGGHILFQVFWLFPLLLYFLLRFKADKWSGLKAAIVFALAFNELVAYIIQYAFVILIGIYLYLFSTNYKTYLKELVRWLMLFISVVPALTFYRLATILPIAIQFPRLSDFRIHYSLQELFKMFFVPYVRLQVLFPGRPYASTVELSTYLGIIAFVMFILSFLRGFRWWHAVALVLIWCTIGNDRWYYFMYWIQKLPGFSSHLCFTRIRIFALFFIGIAATWGVYYICLKYRDSRVRFLRYLSITIGFFMILEVLSVSYLIMCHSHVRLASWQESPHNKFKNISELPRPKDAPADVCFTYRAIRMNLGWLHSQGDSYLPQDSIRIGCDQPGYIAEFYQGGKPVDPIYWSPNRILFKNLVPHLPLVVNITPGNAWYNNGKQLFPDYKIVEPSKPFEIMPNRYGIVDLVYKHPGQRMGVTGMLVLLLIAVFLIWGINKKTN